MKLINCKDCGKEVSKNAKVCPHCGKDQRNFFMKHKIITFIGIIILLIAVGSITSKKETPSDKSTATKTEQKTEKAKTVITKENYDKIDKDMTKEQVEDILGKAETVSESETPGVGKMEMHHYQKGFDGKAITVTYLENKVYTKNWTQL